MTLVENALLAMAESGSGTDRRDGRFGLLSGIRRSGGRVETP